MKRACRSEPAATALLDLARSPERRVDTTVD
jgi:hypothetical protein